MATVRLFALAIAFVATLASAEQQLRSLREIDAFVNDATPRNVPFTVTGRVLSTFSTPNTSEIILSDETGARVEFYRFLNLSQPDPGDTIKASGIACMCQNHEPYIRIDEFDILAHGPRPEPLSVRLSETNAKDHHLLPIRTEGVVIDAFPDEIDRRFLILILKDKDLIIPVSLTLDTFGDRKDLVDATVRVTGVYRRSVGGVRKFSRPTIILYAPEDIEIITPPPKDPFSFPPIENRLYLTHEDIALMSKRSVIGEVLATWSNDRAMLRTKDGRIVNLTLTKGRALPPCGEAIVAVGQPETDLFRINLTAVQWKAAAEKISAETNETAKTGTAATFWSDNGRNSIRGEAHGALLSVRGIVRTLPSPNDTDLRFVLDTGTLSIPVDATSNPNVVSKLQIGCEVQVTGRCVLLTDTRQQDYSFLRVRGFALVIRSPADIVVLNRPS